MSKKLLALLFLAIFCGGAVFAANKIINLPDPKILGKMSVEESIFRRRSEHSFLPNELTMDQISQLLWSAQGITDKGWGFRAAPSSGALYPLTLYIMKKDGIYKYIPDGHKLSQISGQDSRPSIVRASLGQSFIGEAPLVIIIAGNYRIVEAKYGQRSYRYLNMEIGHVAENIALQSVALGLVSVTVGAFWDDVVAKTLELPDTQDPFYILPVGYLKSGS
jgi:SagB-type dehydrogenase family enzyme